MDQLKSELESFLLSRKENIFNRWKEKIIMPSDQMQKQILEKSGQLLFNMIDHMLSLSDMEECDTYIQVQAEHTAKMDIGNISSFIYNVNVAKNELLIEMANFSGHWEKIQPLYFQCAQMIDQFLTHFVDYYMAAKDDLYSEQNQTNVDEHEDRLSLLGKMTSSFVHEFRNPLTTVHGFIQLLHSENPDLPYLNIISGELEQLKFRITQFLMLSRKESYDLEKSVFTLNELLSQIASFIYPRLLESSVELELDLEDNLFVDGYMEELRQVMINIIFNAIDVLSSQEKSSVIKIKGYRDEHLIVLKTANTGPKIPDHLLATIFEPFVTTKKTGTGLGLYVCKQIIEKHQGTLYCTSDEDWTTFTITIPALPS